MRKMPPVLVRDWVEVGYMVGSVLVACLLVAVLAATFAAVRGLLS